MTEYILGAKEAPTETGTKNTTRYLLTFRKAAQQNLVMKDEFRINKLLVTQKS